MTSALKTIAVGRGSVLLEIWFSAITAIGLVILVAKASLGTLGFWVACSFGLTGATLVARNMRGQPSARIGIESAWSHPRLWVALGLAQLALSAFANDSLAVAALWLPTVTAMALQLFAYRGLEGTKVDDGAHLDTPLSTLPAAVEEIRDETDRYHTVEWSQTQDSTGLKSLSGIARLTFRPGERRTELHLAFCPPFAVRPILDSQQTSGPNVRIKVTQVMPYGARVEIQRAEAAAWSVVGIEFSAALAIAEAIDTPLRKAS